MKIIQFWERIPAFQSNRNLMYHRSTVSMIKRLLDVVGSIIGVAILALVFVPVVVAIMLDNPGPIFYKQTRCGLNGRPFQIRKFRSMVVNAEALKASCS